MTTISPILRHNRSTTIYRLGDPVSIRFQPEDLIRMTASMIDKLVTWINKWQDYNNDPEHQSDPTSHYTPRDFTDGPASTLELRAAYEAGYYHTLVLYTSDGDEGGGSTLTGYFNTDDYPPHTAKPAPAPWYLTQEFDTMIHFIIEEGEFVNTPEPIIPDPTEPVRNIPLADPPFGNF